MNNLKHKVPYGQDQSLELELTKDLYLIKLSGPEESLRADPEVMVRESLENPLDFPAISQTVIPGDTVALAVDSPLVFHSRVLASVVSCLCELQIEPQDISIVLPEWFCKENKVKLETWIKSSQLPEELLEQVHWIIHNPNNRDELTYIAANEQGEQILLNRTLSEADVVIPISHIKPIGTGRYSLIESALVPTFSDYEFQKSFEAMADSSSAVIQDKLNEKASHVVWQLGVIWGIQIVPGNRGSISHVCTGLLKKVSETAQTHFINTWSHELQQLADATIATLEGESKNLSWDDISQAIETAGHITAEGGPIVLLSEIDQAPPENFTDQLNAITDDYVPDQHGFDKNPYYNEDSESSDYSDDDQDQESSEPQPGLLKQNSEYQTVKRIAKVLENHSIFLMSRLENELVEELGMTPIDSSAEVSRLISSFESCAMIRSAQLVSFTSAVSE